jgi:transcriptional regulator with XRE-family HTH domain
MESYFWDVVASRVISACIHAWNASVKAFRSQSRQVNQIEAKYRDDFGCKLRTLRTRSGPDHGSITALAIRVGVSPSELTAYENGSAKLSPEQLHVWTTECDAPQEYPGLLRELGSLP